MVWGGISLGGRTALHVLARGSLTAIRYRDEILRPLVRPYAGAVGPGFLLMQDNARHHVAGVCQQFLQDEGIDAMDWPTRSPDLNPIEHICGHHVLLHPPTPRCTTDCPGVGGCFSPGRQIANMRIPRMTESRVQFRTLVKVPSHSLIISIVHSRDQLFTLRITAALPEDQPDVPRKLKRKRWGCRARVKRHGMRRRYRPPLHHHGEQRSLPNKMDELVLTQHQWEYGECIYRDVANCASTNLYVRTEGRRVVRGREEGWQHLLTIDDVTLDTSLFRISTAARTLNCINLLCTGSLLHSEEMVPTPTPQGAQQLQAGSSEVSSDEDVGETVPAPPDDSALVKKGNSRLFRRLRSFCVQRPLLRTFYDSVVASAILLWNSLLGQAASRTGTGGE
ncbi:hypothetical protein L3Q82_005044 [Scortum barcoo]|uniref:Uncharacterized protein n=1 Tax=Scortum barcoo TaxID=214431 RepID=A0ACB8VEB7_9TELE|nr:hypothetical protein L3Q82_005044 [Scortum barcoo]